MSLPPCLHLRSSYLWKVRIFHHFDNICHLLLSLTSLITVNNLPFMRRPFILGVCLWGTRGCMAGVCQFLGQEHVRILLIKTYFFIHLINQWNQQTALGRLHTDSSICPLQEHASVEPNEAAAGICILRQIGHFFIGASCLTPDRTFKKWSHMPRIRAHLKYTA